MPALTEKHIAVLGPLISPFERSPTKSLEIDLKTGEGHKEGFEASIHDGFDNGKPTNPFVQLTIEERAIVLDSKKVFEKCYLWVIDDVGIKIMWENTSNVLRGEELPKKPYVCHTNITGCGKAFIGGELYFCEDGCIYVNFASDRYGRPETLEKKNMVVEVMEYVGYKNVKLLKDFFL